MAPPTSVPIARPTRARGPKCGSSQRPMSTPPAIDPKLKKLDAIAGMPKTCLALSIPITRAASDTKRMNGYMMRASITVRRAFSASKPGANKSTRSGAITIPITQATLNTTAARVATLLASRHADWSPCVAIVLENVVMNAVDSAPSAKRSRNRFGVRNATVNASMARPPPKSAAKICSRIRPRMRLHMTARPTMPAALVLTWLVEVCRSAGMNES